VDSDNGRIIATFVKMEADQKEPVEFLLEGDFEKALQAYRTVLKRNANYPTAAENYLKDLGDNMFITQNRIKLARDIYKMNTILYPNSFKVYEDYGKVCSALGEIDLAIENYSKSLELNPQNNVAKGILEELRESE